MSQNNNFPSLNNGISSVVLNNSNNDGKSIDEIQDDLTVVNNNGWANFDNANQNLEVNHSWIERIANPDFRLFL